MRGPETAYLLAVMRRFDTRMMARLFAAAGAGATTGRSLVDTDLGDDDVRAGALAVPFALYFSPDSDQHPGVLFYRAVPLLGENAEAELVRTRDAGFPVTFVATPSDANGIAYAIGCREDLTL